MKKIILSGMRPTGKLHLGHLVGALNNWVKLESEYQCFFMVADWHALMSEYANPKVLHEYAIDNVVDWISAGVDPKKSVIFIQSEVPAHLELYMILSCLVPLGWLERCPTYKEQLKELSQKEINTFGFLGYPVLQAADILIYKANAVPVGQDQLAHLELTREIARRFNHLYKKEVFPDPAALLTKTSKLLGLDGRKMSKSYQNTIDISESSDSLEKKIKNMVTDQKRIKLLDAGHPDECNVFTYYSTFVQNKKDEVYDWCVNAKVGCTKCKEIFLEEIKKILKPIQEKRKEILNDKATLKKILEQGREKANEIANVTLKEVKKIIF
ncbi:MAG: tryptophan--tRNA ligase [Candidatus Omnitrophota bacterium]